MRQAKLILLVCLIVSLVTSASAHQLINKSLPDIIVKDSNNKRTILSSTLNRPLILFFWSIGCGSCEEEIGLLDDLYRKHKADNFSVVGIHLAGSADFIKQILNKESYRVTYPMYVDEYMKTAVEMNIIKIPTVFIVDSKGIIRKIYESQIPISQIITNIKSLN